MQPRIIIGVPVWDDNDTCMMAERLAGGLAGLGWDAQILLTEIDAVGVAPNADQSERPAHLAFAELPCGKHDPWHVRWMTLVRYLEERAPCFFITSRDWRNSVVARGLSDRVYIVAFVDADDNLEMAQLYRVGYCFNAIVTRSEQVHFNIAHERPNLASRMVTIRDNGDETQNVLNSYTALFARVEEMARQGQFIRPRGAFWAPPTQIDGLDVFTDPNPEWEAGQVNRYPYWPNPAPPAPSANARPGMTAVSGGTAQAGECRLEDYKIIAAIPGGRIGSADIFTSNLIRRLRQQGLDAKVIGARTLWEAHGLPLADDIPVESLSVPDYATWLARWDLMSAYLEANAPCIYLPNHDFDYSAVCSRLSDRVKVIAIAHSDDPLYYENTLRLGPVSNAVVGVSKAIVGHLTGLDPTLGPRLRHIPYGVEVAPPPARAAVAGAPLRIIYAGRLADHQKRVSDLIRIAEGLADRGIPFELTLVGDGPDRDRVYSEGKKLILQRAVWLPGKLNNAEVIQVLCANDVFLQPSTFEGLSMGLLEAMANGVVPVVSSMRSGAPDIIRNGQNGLIVPVGDIDRYVDHLAALYHDPDQRARMARAAYETVCAEGYSLDDMIRRYIDLFNEVIAQPFVRPVGPLLPPSSLHGELAWRRRMAHNFTQSVRSASAALRGKMRRR